MLPSTISPPNIRQMPGITKFFHPRSIMKLSIRRVEESLRELVADFEAENPALHYGVVIVEAGVDSRVLNFAHQFAGAGKLVRRAIRYQTIHNEVQVGRSEKVFQNS